MWTLKVDPSATFYLAPPRAFELLFGAIIACPDIRVTFSQKIRNGLSILGLAFIVIALAVYNHQMPFPGPAAAFPCLGASLIILAGTGDGASSFAGRIVSTKVITWFGNLSYSLYLWHWPCADTPLSSLNNARSGM
jgi:peptidoglycan/LPS O-acetylase OafA/YrhL